MKVFFAVLVLLFLPALAFATDTNSDANSLDANSFTGPILLRLEFEHQVVSTGDDFNASGWWFSKDQDFAFEVDVPSLDKLYFLDFEDKRTHVYDNIVPDGWSPMVSASQSFSFHVNNLLGEADADLFLLWKSDLGKGVVHLEPGQATSVQVSRPTDYYLLVDADDYGNASFSLDTGEFDVGVTVNFKKMPSAYEYVEKWGMSCSENSQHRCLIMPDGTEFDFDSCISADSEQNKVIGEGCPPEICINGPNAYREWKEDKLAEKLEAERAARALAEEKSDPELASDVKSLERKIDELGTGLNTASQQSTDSIVSWGLGALLGIGLIIGGFVINRKAVPIQPISFKKKFEEVKEYVQEKRKAGNGGEAVEPESRGHVGRDEDDVRGVHGKGEAGELAAGAGAEPVEPAEPEPKPEPKFDWA